MKLFRKRVVPAALRPPFARDERVLAWAMSGSAAVIATNLGLWRNGVCTGWHDISKAVWDGSVLSVTTCSVLSERDGYTLITDDEPDRLPLADPGHLPHQIRLRVTASVWHPSHHGLPGSSTQGGGVWIAARRVPGKDGLKWVMRFDQGTDPDDPAVLAAADEIFKETYWRTVGPSE